MADPVFQHGSFRLYLLQALEGGARHGYDIIASLDEQFGGSYRPSPGTVYPRLERLLRDGLVSVTREGRKRMYSLTDAGRAELARHAEELAAINDDMNDSVQRLAMDVRARVSESLGALRADLAAAQQRADAAPAHPAPHTATRRQNELRSELILLSSKFASQLRADAYKAAARGELTEEHVAELRERLDGFSLHD